MFRNVTLKCINEIGGLELSREYDDKFVILHDMTMSSLKRIIPLDTGKYPTFANHQAYFVDIRQAYDQTNDSEVQDFIQNLALFFSTFLGKHVKVLF
jgi:exportin-1